MYSVLLDSVVVLPCSCHHTMLAFQAASYRGLQDHTHLHLGEHREVLGLGGEVEEVELWYECLALLEQLFLLEISGGTVPLSYLF